MKIEIVSGSGTGKTELAAFDNALFDAGIANYNLILLSSVIPPKAKILEVSNRNTKDNEYGNKLYVVMARSFAIKKGNEAWCGLGWVNHKDGSGKGLFVEQFGKSKRSVQKSIKQTLESMAEYRPEERGKIYSRIEGIRCDKEPVCSIVVAVYKSESWN